MKHQHYNVTQKGDTTLLSIISINTDQFSNSFTGRHTAVKRSLKIPPDLRCVATLPSEILVRKQQ